VGVDQIGIPRSDHRPHSTGGREVPVRSHAHRGGGDSGGSQSPNEWRVWRGDDERFVTLLTLPPRQEVHLSLSTAPFSAGIEVEYTERCRLGHLRRMRRATHGRNANALGIQLTRPNVARGVRGAC
jgi:hypothetical protein